LLTLVRRYRRRQRLQTAGVLTRGHADEHLLDDAPIQRIFAGHHRERRQRDFFAVGAHARATHRDFSTAEDDLARCGASSSGLALGLMLVARTADRRPIVFEHRGKDFQTGRDGELHQLCAGIDQEINERQMALVGRIDLVRPIGCARLSFHGGSCWRAFRPGLVTGRIARPVRSRRLKFQQLSGHLPRTT
jgi:hypothetical protein